MSYSTDPLGTTAHGEPGEELRQQTGRFVKRMEIPKETYVIAVAGSIALSAYLFLTNRKDWGVFVGLWAPTILNLGLYNKLIRPGERGGIHQYGASPQV